LSLWASDIAIAGLTPNLIIPCSQIPHLEYRPGIEVETW
jgi:hypothetical protein